MLAPSKVADVPGTESPICMVAINTILDFNSG